MNWRTLRAADCVTPKIGINPEYLSHILIPALNANEHGNHTLFILKRARLATQRTLMYQENIKCIIALQVDENYDI